MAIQELLEEKHNFYNHPDFIEDDPISIPHQFTKKQDIEIMGFFAAIFAWGQRKTILAKCRELISLMDGKPYDFVSNHRETDLKRMLAFKHRTFHPTDLLYFLRFFRDFYQRHNSLEDAFIPSKVNGQNPVEAGLAGFRDHFFSLADFPERTKKHIATPAKQSTCKRLNMFLRWMVRQDERGVDFGIWQRIEPTHLLCPFDVHVERVARVLGLVTRKTRDWKAVCELTENLREFDAYDPVKYDFALYGMGVMEKGYIPTQPE